MIGPLSAWSDFEGMGIGFPKFSKTINSSYKVTHNLLKIKWFVVSLNQRVVGSNPTAPTSHFKDLTGKNERRPTWVSPRGNQRGNNISCGVAWYRPLGQNETGFRRAMTFGRMPLGWRSEHFSLRFVGQAAITTEFST